jgi:DNA repair ATPase RecN
MAKNPQQKDEALEALDFIVNVLKEHERDLDKLISELATVTEQMGEPGELSEKVNQVEEKISGLQKQVNDLVGAVSGYRGAAPMVTVDQPVAPATSMLATAPAAPTVVLQCKKWEDFKNLAAGAQTVSYSYKEEEKLFQAEALKGNHVMSYNGSLPEFSALLKSFLSKDLRVPEQGIFEGVLAVS